MTPLKRATITASAVVLVGLAGLVARTLILGGAFEDVKPVPLACTAIPGVIGAEDLAIDAKSGLLFASAMDRRAPGSKADGIYALPLAHPELGFTKLAGTPSVFHPHGISLFRASDGSLTLMAVNHMGSDRRAPEHHAIDIFEVTVADGMPKLNEIGDIQSDKLLHPNDVAAVGKTQFYVTNDHGSVTPTGRELENYLTLPRANLLYFDGAVFREAATGLVFANGVAVSNDGRHLYVAEATTRHIRTFGRDAFSGRLTEESSLDLSAGPDNIDVAADGALWVAGHPKLFDVVAYSTDPSKPSPTEIFKLAVKDGIPDSAATVYANDGHEIGAGSVGVAAGEDLFIGSIFDAKILACRLP
ncbi:MAG TPA: SMP-30/gluconolactonase/LRE family protein [Rhizomicrobium sp.]|nr:SMP-30/gluconolactonase/LRE family protein [Rhizomicrobium sp.]